MSVRDDGRAYDDMLVRELGRLVSPSGPRCGKTPNDSLFIEELGRGTWLGLEDVEALKLVGVVSSPASEEEVVEPIVRFLERIVTVDGTPGTPP